MSNAFLKGKPYLAATLHVIWVWYGSGIIIPDTKSQEALVKTNKGNNRSHEMLDTVIN